MYRGPSLAHVYDLKDEWRDVVRDIAEEAGRRHADDVRIFTPVGHQPFQPDYVPGELLASIRKKDVVEVAVCVYETGAETDVEYAPYVENGTGLWGPTRDFYVIRPKNPDGWLRFHDKAGNVIFAKRVLHPGSPGAHMFSRGADKTEVEFEFWATLKLEEWVHVAEAGISIRAHEKVLMS